MSSLSGDGGKCNHRVSSAGLDLCAEHSNLDGKPHARSRFLIQCQRFNMSEDALEAWNKLHVQVEQAILMWITLSLASLALFAYLLAGTPAVGLYAYLLRVPIAWCLVQRAFVVCGVWRYGQPFYGTVAFKITFLPVTPCLLFFSLAGFLSPTESIPFRSTLHFTAVHASLSWTLNCLILTVPLAIPSEPCRRIVYLPVSALMTTLRSIDSLTDLSFLRVLAVLVCARFLLLLLFVFETETLIACYFDSATLL